MPSSPIRARVVRGCLSQAEVDLKEYLQHHLVQLDNVIDDPNDMELRGPYNGENYHFVGGPTPKFKWKDVSASSRERLHQFLDLYVAACATGLFQAPHDMNAVARAREEEAFYKNQALVAQADALAAAFNLQNGGTVSCANLVARGLISDVRIW